MIRMNFGAILNSNSLVLPASMRQLNKGVSSKDNYFKAKLSDSKNSKESWQFINELLNKISKTSQIREINFNGKTVTKDEEIAAGFNEYFSTIGSMLPKATKDCDTDPLSFLTVTHDDIFNFNFITIQGVSKKCLQLENSR